MTTEKKGGLKKKVWLVGFDISTMTVDGDGKADAPKGQEFGIPVAWAYTEQMYDCHQFLMGRYHLVGYNYYAGL